MVIIHNQHWGVRSRLSDSRGILSSRSPYLFLIPLRGIMLLWLSSSLAIVIIPRSSGVGCPCKVTDWDNGATSSCQQSLPKVHWNQQQSQPEDQWNQQRLPEDHIDQWTGQGWGNQATPSENQQWSANDENEWENQWIARASTS